MNQTSTRPLLWLVCATLIIHLLVLEWLVRSQPGHAPLVLMDEPEFNQTLQPGQPDSPAQRSPGADADAPDEPPPPTVGQVVLARTVLPPPARPARTPAPARPAPPAQAKQAPATTPQAAPEAAAPEPTQPAATTAGEPAPPPANPPATDTAHAAKDPTPQPAPTASSTPNALPANISEQKMPSALAGTEKSATSSGPENTRWIDNWPASTRLTYSLKGYFRGDVFGDARVQWQRSGEQYQAQVGVTLGLFVNIRLTSQGHITPTRLWPEVYEESRLGKLRSARMGQQQVTLDNGSTILRPAQLQDTASQFVQLSQDFASGRLPLKVGAVIPVTLARPGGIDDWVYDVVALDTLATPLGELPAYHLQPRPLANPRNTIATDMWFAPGLQHLPVRIKLSLNADTWLDLSIQEVAQTAH